jgi:VWFA-related protein
VHRFARLMSAGCAAGLAVWIAGPAAGQSFRSATDLIAVTVTVRDSDARLITDLPGDRFEILEDGLPQPVAAFTSERVPVSLAIVIDVSESMFGSRIQEARAAIEQFVVDLLDPGDEFSIIGFNHDHRVLVPWTSDRSAAPVVLRAARPAGSTALYDAIVATLPLTGQRNRQRVALLVITDGADTASEATIRDVRTALVRSEAFVYAIAIDPADRRPLNASINPAALQEITDQSGGRTLVVRSTGEMISALSEIAEELAGQYLIGYVSPKAGDGQFHSIRVRVRDADYRVRARTGYVAVPARTRSR